MAGSTFWPVYSSPFLPLGLPPPHTAKHGSIPGSVSHRHSAVIIPAAASISISIFIPPCSWPASSRAEMPPFHRSSGPATCSCGPDRLPAVRSPSNGPPAASSRGIIRSAEQPLCCSPLLSPAHPRTHPAASSAVEGSSVASRGARAADNAVCREGGSFQDGSHGVGSAVRSRCRTEPCSATASGAVEGRRASGVEEWGNSVRRGYE